MGKFQIEQFSVNIIFHVWFRSKTSLEHFFLKELSFSAKLLLIWETGTIIKEVTRKEEKRKLQTFAEIYQDFIKDLICSK